jgi:hypothetical protein
MTIYTDRRATRQTASHVLLDRLLPVLVAERKPVLHASAVSVEGRAIGFIGTTGSGKSTLAAALVDSGASLLADDAMVIGFDSTGIVVEPTSADLRLWSNPELDSFSDVGPVGHHTTKRRLRPNRRPTASAANVPLDGIYLVKRERGRTTSVARPVAPTTAFELLLRNSYQHGEANGRKAVQILAEFSRIVDLVPVYTLHVPDDLRHIGGSTDAVLRDDR